MYIWITCTLLAHFSIIIYFGENFIIIGENRSEMLMKNIQGGFPRFFLSYLARVDCIKHRNICNVVDQC